MRLPRDFERPNSRTGFTLVELLVVIGIIALLIAILLPALARARESANMVKCLSTLRSMHQAAQLHAVEHQGYMPLAGFQFVVLTPAAVGDADQRKYIYFRDESNPDPKGNDGLTPAPLSAALGLYMNLNLDFSSKKKLQACLQQESLIRCFSCPSDTNPPTKGTTIAGKDHPPGPDELMSYIFNQAVLGRRDQYPDLCPMGKLTRIRHASEVFLFGDGTRGAAPEHAYGVIEDMDDWTLYDYWDRHAEPDATTTIQTANFDYKRHKKKMNVVFVDGHAETIQMPDFKTHGDFDRVGVSRGIYR
jgi:prepilin-type N-terminal cleavage/methylation domain-containing protein/prepilin-type processing-associated H-X9-DG protein